MPVLGLIRLLREVELLKTIDFFFKLDYEANLRANAEVANAKEADSL